MDLFWFLMDIIYIVLVFFLVIKIIVNSLIFNLGKIIFKIIYNFYFYEF